MTSEGNKWQVLQEQEIQNLNHNSILNQYSTYLLEKSSYLEQSLICVNSFKCSLHPRPRPPQKPKCTVCDYLSDFTIHSIISEVVAEENHKISSGCNPATVFHICLHFNWFIFFKGPLFMHLTYVFLTKQIRALFSHQPYYRQCFKM